MVVHTYTGLQTLANTKKQALWFSAVMAVDMGYTSKLTKIKGGHRVTVSDGKAVDFLA